MGSIQEALSEGFRNVTGALTGPVSPTANSASPSVGMKRSRGEADLSDSESGDRSVNNSLSVTADRSDYDKDIIDSLLDGVVNPRRGSEEQRKPFWRVSLSTMTWRPNVERK